MNGRILVVCASRGRPTRLARMLESLKKTSTVADVAVYIDEDQKDDYAYLAGECKMLVGDRIGQCASLNHLIRKCPGYEVYGAATDDCTFDTPDWDRWVFGAKRSMRAGIGLIAPYSNGRHNRMDFPWATGEWITVVGNLTILHTHHSYWDVALQLLGEKTQIVFAGPSDFKLWHESLQSEDRADDSLGSVGKMMYQIYHVHNDAREVCMWLAHSLPDIAKKVNDAIEKYDRKEPE